jgi:hypothetical protein
MLDDLKALADWARDCANENWRTAEAVSAFDECADKLRALLASAPAPAAAEPVGEPRAWVLEAPWEGSPGMLAHHDKVTESLRAAMTGATWEPLYKHAAPLPGGEGRDAKDAARYRWLRDESGNYGYKTPTVHAWCPEDGPPLLEGADLDAAIDTYLAALSATP